MPVVNGCSTTNSELPADTTVTREVLERGRLEPRPWEDESEKLGGWNREIGRLKPRKWEVGTETFQGTLACRRPETATFFADNLYNLL